MRRRLLPLAAALPVLLSGCTDEGSGRAAADPLSGTSASTPTAERSTESESPEDRAVRIRQEIDVLLTPVWREYGEGTKSPCSSSSPRLFTQECAEAVGAIDEVADAALKKIGEDDRYRTLREIAVRTNRAAEAYAELGCAQDPAKADTRKLCLDAGETIAQAPTDLEEGAVAGISGI